MKRSKKNIVIIVLSMLLAISVGVNAALWITSSSNMPKPPEMNSKAGGEEINNNSADYSGATQYDSSVNKTGVTYQSSKGGQNSLLVSGGKSTITNAKVTKTGDESSENSDFTGTNAGVLVYNKATLNINGGSVDTNGAHANGVFAYGSGTVNISKTTITTSANNSGGIMVTGGGTLNAHNLLVTTQGNSSAAIRSDRGGGVMTIEGGQYTTNGQGSPAIYSTANVKVKKAQLTATKSEGVVIEGKNSVSLTDTKLTDTNNTLNGNSTTYKNIFIYQSMSGDASEGTGNFTAKNCDIITNKGDSFYITNTQAVIKLTNNRFVNKDGDFMRIEAAKWGNSGSNGGNVSLQFNNQSVKGDIVVDSISVLKMNLTNKSSYIGSINKGKKGTVSLTISKDSTIKLTGDTYVKKLKDEDKTYSNVDLNGYKMYVDGKLLKK